MLVCMMYVCFVWQNGGTLSAQQYRPVGSAQQHAWPTYQPLSTPYPAYLLHFMYEILIFHCLNAAFLCCVIFVLQYFVTECPKRLQICYFLSFVYFEVWVYYTLLSCVFPVL